MSETRHCPVCKTALLENAPEGFCPVCQVDGAAKEPPLVDQKTDLTPRNVRSSWFRRNPVTTALLAVTFLVLGAAAVAGVLVARQRQKAATAAQQKTLDKWYASDGFLADRALKDVNVDAILRAVQEAKRRQPDNARLWRAEGTLLQKAGKTDSSYAAFSRAIELAQAQTDSSVRKDSLLRRSALLRQMNRLPEAAVDFRRAKRLPVPRQADGESLPDFRTAQEVSLVLGFTNVESGLYIVEIGDSKHEPGVVDGQEAWSFKGGWNYCYFFVDPTYKWVHGSDLVLRVECKTGTGRPIGVDYHSARGAYTRINPNKVLSAGSNRWQLMEFHLKDVRLENAQNGGADFRLRDNEAGFIVRRATLFPFTNSTALTIPARHPQAAPNLIDLTPFYNAALDESWHDVDDIGNDLARLKVGVQMLAGTQFDIRGIVQLAGRTGTTMRRTYPTAVSRLPVKGNFSSIHFLHATGWRAANGTTIGHYLIHYANASSELVPLDYGVNIAEWFVVKPETASLAPGTVVAWKGSNIHRDYSHEKVQLFKFTWRNPHPDWPITTIDFSSALAKPAPFLIAITGEQ